MFTIPGNRGVRGLETVEIISLNAASNSRSNTTNSAYGKANTACTQSDVAGTQANNAYVAANNITGIYSTMRVYTTTGQTWSKPAGLSFIIVECIGAGGGGGGSTVGITASGTGGGAGGYARRTIAAASLGSTEAITVGTGGAAGVSSGPGGAGGSSSFGTTSFLTACGGAGGLSGATQTGSVGASGGLATSGDINSQGGDGGGAGVFSQSGAAANSGEIGGEGGTSWFGGGGSSGRKATSGSTKPGRPGKAIGSGGAGGAGATGASASGGPGLNGAVIVWEFIGRTAPTEINFIDSVTRDVSNTSATIPLMTGIKKGDLLVLFDEAFETGVPALVTPTGWTNIQNDGLTDTRYATCYRICDGSEGGTTITGMGGASGMDKVVLHFRGNAPVTKLTLGGSYNHEATSGDPAVQTITSSGGSGPIIAWAGYGVSTQPTTRTFSPVIDGTVIAGAATDWNTVKYKVFNVSPVDITVDLNDTGSVNILSSAYYQIS